jgi:hypothetical protein
MRRADSCSVRAVLRKGFVSRFDLPLNNWEQRLNCGKAELCRLQSSVGCDRRRSCSRAQAPPERHNAAVKPRQGKGHGYAGAAQATRSRVISVAR